MSTKKPKPASKKAGGEAAPKAMGRPTVYDKEQADAIIARIAMGDSLKSICADESMPAESTFRLWATNDIDGLAARYARAYEARGDLRAEEVEDIGQRALRGEVDSAAARVAMDAMKWAASKFHARRYGDRQAIEHTGKDGGPIQTQDVQTPEERAARIAELNARLGYVK